MSEALRADDHGARGRAAPSASERALIVATQGGLPLSARPYDELAARLGMTPQDVMQLFRRLLSRGAVRRIAAVPNHYRLGYEANGMSVWDVDDEAIAECGRTVGALPFVSHCYRRPRRLPQWRYNLFAMVHGRDREEVEQKVELIAERLGDAARAHEVLYSTRILKKTGLRLA